MNNNKFKSNLEIAKEWDEIANIRYQQIKFKSDVSFHRILLPNLFKLIDEIKVKSGHFNRIIDVGCGIGYLTSKLCKYGEDVLGVDISGGSIEIAKQEYNQMSNISFKNISVEELAKSKSSQFDLAIANMVLMDLSNLDDSIAAIYNILNEEGNFLFTITHPFFWPEYCGYSNNDWFNYNEEILIESKFKITNEKTDKSTSHIHRPLERYLEALRINGFKIIDIIEPMPSEDDMSSYAKKWEYPRFLVVHCHKNG